MTIFDFMRPEDHTVELGLDLHSPEVNAAVDANSQRMRAQVVAGKRRKEALKTNIIVALCTTIAVTSFFAAATDRKATATTQTSVPASAVVSTVPADAGKG